MQRGRNVHLAPAFTVLLESLEDLFAVALDDFLVASNGRV
jgi:hypothetical protein